MVRMLFEKDGKYVVPRVYADYGNGVRAVAYFENGVYEIVLKKERWEEVMGSPKFDAGVAAKAEMYRKLSVEIPAEYDFVVGDKPLLTYNSLTPAERLVVKNPVIPQINKKMFGKYFVDVDKIRRTVNTWEDAIEYSEKLYSSSETVDVSELKKKLKNVSLMLGLLDDSMREIFGPDFDCRKMRIHDGVGSIGSVKVDDRIKIFITAGDRAIIPFREGLFVVGDMLHGDKCIEYIAINDSVENAKRCAKYIERVDECDYVGDIVVGKYGIRVPEITAEMRRKAREVLTADSYLFHTKDRAVLEFIATGNMDALVDVFKYVFFECATEKESTLDAYSCAAARLKEMLEGDVNNLLDWAAERYSRRVRAAEQM